MTYATELIRRYRQALHQLWNMHFWAAEAFRDYASVQQFDRVKVPLFLSLVIDRMGSDLEQPTRLFGEALRVVPRVTQPHSTIQSLMVESPNSKGAWKIVSGPFGASDLNMCLLDFFDFNLLAWRDFQCELTNAGRANRWSDVAVWSRSTAWVSCGSRRGFLGFRDPW